MFPAGPEFVEAGRNRYDDFLRWPTAAGVLAAIAAVCAPNGAPAQAAPVSSLSWSRLPGAESCIGAPELARRVEARLGRRALFAPSQADRSVEGRVGPRAGGGWSAVVALARPDGTIVSQREIETREPSCRTLDAALVLVVGLLVDPDGAPPAPAEPPPAVIIREVRVEQPWHLAAVSGVELERGPLPSLAPSATVGVAVDPPGVPAIELAAFATTRESADGDLDGRSADLRLVGGRVAVCPRLAGGRTSLVLCAALRASWLRWRGVGFERTADGTLFAPDLGAELRGELGVTGRVRAFAALGARVPLRRTEVTFATSPAVSGDPDGTTEVLFRQAPVSVGIALGLALAIF